MKDINNKKIKTIRKILINKSSDGKYKSKRKIGRKLQLLIQNTLLIYKQILKLVWAYDQQLWGLSKNSKTKYLIKKYILWIKYEMFYMQTYIIHRKKSKDLLKNVKTWRHNHVNIEMLKLLIQHDTKRMLKTTKPSE